MTIWFTSDTHFGHFNILKHCSRPFKDCEEMDSVIIENYNRVVSDKDTVYHLGDFGYRNKLPSSLYLGQLKGHKHLIIGNHDNKDVLRAGWESVQEYKEVNRGGDHPLVLFHYPILSWKGAWRKTYHLHGHSHGKVPIDPHYKRWDVGVDPQNFFPIELDEVLEYFSMLEEGGK